MEHADPQRFLTALARACDRASLALPADVAARCAEHYRLLQLWNPKVNLVASTEPALCAERHYLEGLVAASLLPAEWPSGAGGLDVGSGAGFPGLVLSAARPDVPWTLLEPRHKRAAFLAAAARACGLQVQVLAVRLEEIPGDRTWGAVTSRAVALTPRQVARHLAPGGCVLLFAGPTSDLALWRAEGLEPDDTRRLPGSDRAICRLVLRSPAP